MSGVKLSNKDEYKLFCNIYILIYMYYLHVCRNTLSYQSTVYFVLLVCK